jgi:predicted phosphodiesterase
MARLGLISDIHGNLEALEAVLSDSAKRNLDALLCLGDIVGYGPNPIECVLKVMRHCKVTLMGNHDLAVYEEPVGWNPHARIAYDWTVKQIANHPAIEVRNFVQSALQTLPRNGATQNGITIVHGSPRDPIHEYLMPGDVFDGDKMTENFAAIEWLCFQGHTHVGGIFLEQKLQLQDHVFESARNSRLPSGQKRRIKRPTKALINVGSVGQPRDGFTAACYLILEILSAEEVEIEWVSVAYDFERTIAKLEAIPELQHTRVERLREGS